MKLKAKNKKVLIGYCLMENCLLKATRGSFCRFHGKISS